MKLTHPKSGQEIEVPDDRARLYFPHGWQRVTKAPTKKPAAKKATPRKRAAPKPQPSPES